MAETIKEIDETNAELVKWGILAIDKDWRLVSWPAGIQELRQYELWKKQKQKNDRKGEIAAAKERSKQKVLEASGQNPSGKAPGSRYDL